MLKIKSYEEDLERKNDLIKKLYKTEAENEKLKRETEISKLN